MPIITEYAKVETGVVTNMIVADQTHIDTRADGPWTLTPYNGTTGKVGLGYQCSGSLFLAPMPSALALTETSSMTLSVTAVTSGTPTYQWKKDASDMVGETAATLTIGSVVIADSGSYTCVVGDGVDSLESSACVVTVS